MSVARAVSKRHGVRVCRRKRAISEASYLGLNPPPNTGRMLCSYVAPPRLLTYFPREDAKTPRASLPSKVARSAGRGARDTTSEAQGGA